MRKILNYILILIGFTTYVEKTQAQSVIFREDFGTSRTRVYSDYVPDGVGYFIYADPSTIDNPYTTGSDPYKYNEQVMAYVVENNYYVIVAPSHLKTSMSAPTGYTGYNIFDVTSDHTGDTNGAAMFINAGTTLSTFYKRKLDDNLDEDSFYRLSFYGYVSSGDNPKVSFEILSPSGNTILARQQKELSEDQWKKYEVVFKIPNSCSSTDKKYYISLVNDWANDNGNDFLIDDIELEKLQNYSGDDFITINCAPTAEPKANDDHSNDHTIGNLISYNVLANDELVNGNTPNPADVKFNLFGINNETKYTVPGEGTWSYASGVLTFTPIANFKSNPTPVTYTIQDLIYPLSGDTTPDYAPGSDNLSGTTNQTGVATRATVYYTYKGTPTTEGEHPVIEGCTTNPLPITFDILSNDKLGDGTPATKDNVKVTLFDNYEVELPGYTYYAYGEGTWEYNPTTGQLTFTPDSGFDGEAYPIFYRITDNRTGNDFFGLSSIKQQVAVTFNQSTDNTDTDGDGIPDVCDLQLWFVQQIIY